MNGFNVGIDHAKWLSTDTQRIKNNIEEFEPIYYISHDIFTGAEEELSESAIKRVVEDMFRDYKSLDTTNGTFHQIINDIEKVVFNPPATVIIFKDGEKVVVKTSEDDEFDPEIGFAMAIIKKLFGSRSGFKKFIKKWLPEELDK